MNLETPILSSTKLCKYIASLFVKLNLYCIGNMIKGQMMATHLIT